MAEKVEAADDAPEHVRANAPFLKFGMNGLIAPADRAAADARLAAEGLGAD